MATYLNAPSGRFGTPTNAKKYTISTWLKLAVASTENNFFSYNYGSYQSISIEIRNDDTLRINQYVPGTDTYDIRTNRVFRDPSAWYHIVIKYDSTQSTASDRVKIYINGENQTSLAASSYPGQNVDSFIAATPNNNKGINIGGLWDSSGNPTAGQYFLGYMAQFIYTDGYAYDASTFGSTNTNGIWIPNTGPSVTYGTNGFKLDFAGTGTTANASGFGADTSGNGNHFTANSLGTNPSASDTCQNNFATWNPLVNRSFQYPMTLSEGNLKVIADSNTSYGSTMAATVSLGKGKWFWEFKYTTSGTGGYVVGWGEDTYNFNYQADAYPYKSTLGSSSGVFYRADGGKAVNGTETGSAGDAWAQNDIIGVAADFDASTITFYNQGVSQFTVTSAFTSTVNYYPEFYGYGSKGGQANFGNPPYTIASGNADANGYGNFEYAVPSGYYALCTKNLALYGG